MNPREIAALITEDIGTNNGINDIQTLFEETSNEMAEVLNEVDLSGVIGRGVEAGKKLLGIDPLKAERDEANRFLTIDDLRFLMKDPDLRSAVQALQGEQIGAKLTGGSLNKFWSALYNALSRHTFQKDKADDLIKNLRVWKPLGGKSQVVSNALHALQKAGAIKRK